MDMHAYVVQSCGLTSFHVFFYRPDDSHGMGGLSVVGGPEADALWF